MSENIELPSIEEVECIIEQMQEDYLKVIGDFTPISILQLGITKFKLSESDVSSLINHRDKVNKVYSELSKIEVNTNFMSRKIYEVDLKILSNMSVFLTEIIEKKSVSRTHFVKYQSTRDILTLNGSVFLNLIGLASISLYEEKGVEESLKWLKKKTKRDKKKTKSYNKFVDIIKIINDLNKEDVEEFKEELFNRYKTSVEDLRDKITVFQEDYDDLELVDIF